MTDIEVTKTITRTTVYVSIAGREPEQLGFYKTPTLVTQAKIEYQHNDAETLPGWQYQTDVTLYGYNVKKDGSPGEQWRELRSYSHESHWLDEFVAAHTPWGTAAVA